MEKGKLIKFEGEGIFTGYQSTSATEIEVKHSDGLHERFWIPTSSIKDMTAESGI